MMTATVRKMSAVDPSGRVLVPSEWRTALDLKPGAEVVLVKHSGSIEIMSREEVLRRVQAFGAGLAVPGASAVDELIEERRNQARQEHGS